MLRRRTRAVQLANPSSTNQSFSAVKLDRVLVENICCFFILPSLPLKLCIKSFLKIFWTAIAKQTRRRSG